MPRTVNRGGVWKELPDLGRGAVPDADDSDDVADSAPRLA